MNKLTLDDVEFSVECLPEDAAVRGNASAVDDASDTQIEDEIIERLERGDTWAWCTVRVVGVYEGLEADDFLGCCSYADEADFKNGGYYDDMRQTVLDALNENLERLEARLCGDKRR